MTRSEAAHIIRWVRRERDKFRRYQRDSIIPEREIRLEHFGDAYHRAAKELAHVLSVVYVDHDTYPFHVIHPLRG